MQSTLHSVDGRNCGQTNLIGIDGIEHLASDGFIGRLAFAISIGSFVFGQMRFPRIAFGEGPAARRVAARIRTLTGV